jgi:hypothetical protein
LKDISSYPTVLDYMIANDSEGYYPETQVVERATLSTAINYWTKHSNDKEVAFLIQIINGFRYKVLLSPESSQHDVYKLLVYGNDSENK